VDLKTGQAIEVKYVGNPERSPFAPGSDIQEFIREKILADQESEFYRYGRVISDTGNPLTGLQVVTNDPAAGVILVASWSNSALLAESPLCPRRYNVIWLLTPPEETDWHVTRDELTELLRRDWPGAEVRITDYNAPSARDVVWRLQVSGGELEGSQDRAGQAQYLDGPIGAVARFTAWLRRQVPSTQPLILCDESYSTVVNIQPNVSDREILAAIS
jgi:hypothetical protein